VLLKNNPMEALWGGGGGGGKGLGDHSFFLIHVRSAQEGLDSMAEKQSKSAVYKNGFSCRSYFF